MKLFERAKDIAGDVRAFAEELVDFFRDVSTPAPTAEQALSHFSYHLKERIEQVGQAFPGYAKQEGYEAVFDAAISLLSQNNYPQNPEFCQAVADLLDRTNAECPVAAIQAANKISHSCRMQGAILSARISRFLSDDNIEGEIAGVKALRDLGHDKEESYLVALAGKEPGKILDWYIGSFNKEQFDGPDTKLTVYTFDRFMVERVRRGFYGESARLTALRSIELEPFFEERPADVLLAASVLADPQMNQAAEQAAGQAQYEAFNARAAGHPDAARIGYFVKMIESLKAARMNAAPEAGAPAPG